LIVDEEMFAYPQAGHRLLDGWETIAEMERDLNLAPASLERTLADYNRDATDGVDRRFHKHPDYLKPLDVGPWASFDLSFTRSPYVLLTLGGAADKPERRGARRPRRPDSGAVRRRRVRRPPAARRQGLRQRAEPRPGLVVRANGRPVRGGRQGGGRVNRPPWSICLSGSSLQGRAPQPVVARVRVASHGD
jgi:hypothetical protein